MKVGMYYRNSDVRVEEKPTPVVGAGEILIKVMASGICGSDLLEWYRIKRAPLVLGHELTGEIVEVGEGVSHLNVGDRVFVTHHVPCDECPSCLTGHNTACKVFQTKNNFEYGGFAEFLKVSGRSINTGTLVLPDGMSYEVGTFIEPLGTAVRGARAIELSPGESVMVVGSGLAGILFVKLAKALGAGRVIVTDINDYRMEMAKQFGADATLPATADLAQEIKRINNGRLADNVIICAGALSASKAALTCVERGGTVLFFAVPNPGELVPIDVNPFWRNDITLKTCYGAAPLDNRQALSLLASGAVRVDDMITHRYPLDKIGEAFETAAEATGTLKVIVEPNGI